MEYSPVREFTGDLMVAEPRSAFYTLADLLPCSALTEVVAMARGRLSRRGADRCDELWLPDDGVAAGALGPGLLRRITDTMCEVNDRWWRLDIDTFRFKVLRYAPGHYAPAHMDMFPGSMRRKLTLVVQLSDPAVYTGGELEVIGMGEQWSTIPRQFGLAAVFPSWTRHRVTRVVAGERWALTAWAYGPPVR
ncbi:2OG-Fe(II) oxygenase [Actinokineospora sp.]|uniref:2OG-Fe(II) oxygenase n=1 Tax=Actinokineospora sp. TaxID=1872133 RepID=UPI003D6B75B2